MQAPPAVESPTAGVSSSPGITLRACQNCSVAKSRCIPATEETGGKCARCFKSRKDCFFPSKSTKKRKAPTSSTAELEERIQNLAALLAAQQAQAKALPRTPDSQQAVSEAASTSLHTSPSLIVGQNQPSFKAGPHDSWGRVATESNGATARPSLGGHESREPSTHSVSILSSPIHAKDGDYLLKIYREHFSHRFPFVIIPPNLPARDFRAQRPWLFKAITIIASQDNRGQQLLWGKEFITDLAIAMTVNGEKNLDMLQGLLVYNAWGFSVMFCTPNIASTAHSQLSLALVFDLSLNRTIGDYDLPEMLGNSSKSYGPGPEGNRNTAVRSMEERRTLLAVYFLTTTISWCIKRIEGLQYSPYMEYCRRSLLEFAESETDVILAALVKIASILEKSHRTFLETQYPDGEKVPLWIHAKLAVHELKAYWSSLPPEIQRNELLTTNYYSAEVSLLEACLYQYNFPKDMPNGSIHRLEMLHNCLSSTKRLVEFCFAQPVSNYFTFCIIDIAAIGHGCAILLKLSLVEEFGWDLQHVRQSVSWKMHYERFVSNIEQVGAAIDRNQPENSRLSFYTSAAVKMRKVQAWYQQKIAEESKQVSALPGSLAPLLSVEQVNIFDDRFWEDFMAEGSLI